MFRKIIREIALLFFSTGLILYFFFTQIIANKVIIDKIDKIIEERVAKIIKILEKKDMWY